MRPFEWVVTTTIIVVLGFFALRFVLNVHVGHQGRKTARRNQKRVATGRRTVGGTDG